VDRLRLSARAAEEGVSFLPGYPCFVEEPSAFFARLNFSFAPAERIAEGIARFSSAVRHAVSGHPRVHRRVSQAAGPII
jgi:DNA-binding transcriptional MocR family regulator